MNLVGIGYNKLNQARFGEIIFGLFTSTGKTKTKFDYVTGQENTDSFSVGGYIHRKYQDWYAERFAF